MNESKQDRKRRLSRARSARYRKGKRDQVQRMQGTKFKAVFGAGTIADLEQIRTVGECDDLEETIVMMARFVAAAARNTPDLVRAQMNPRSPV